MNLEMALQKVISEWLSEKKGRSLRLLARKSGLSYPTIFRMSKAEGSFQNPNILRVIQLIFVKAEQVRGFVAEWMPESLPLADEFAKAGVQFVNVSQVSPLMVRIARDVAFKDMDEKSLLERYGSSGANALEKLVENGILEKSGNKITLSSREQSVSSQEYTREAIKQNSEELDLNLPGHFAVATIDGLNLEGSIAIYNLVENFALNLAKLRLDPAYKGDKKVAVSALMTLN